MTIFHEYLVSIKFQEFVRSQNPEQQNLCAIFPIFEFFPVTTTRPRCFPPG